MHVHVAPQPSKTFLLLGPFLPTWGCGAQFTFSVSPCPAEIHSESFIYICYVDDMQPALLHIFLFPGSYCQYHCSQNISNQIYAQSLKLIITKHSSSFRVLKKSLPNLSVIKAIFLYQFPKKKNWKFFLAAMVSQFLLLFYSLFLDFSFLTHFIMLASGFPPVFVIISQGMGKQICKPFHSTKFKSLLYSKISFHDL